MGLLLILFVIIIFVGLCTVNLGLGLALLVFAALLIAFAVQSDNEQKKKNKEQWERNNQKIKEELEKLSFGPGKEFYLGYKSSSPKMKIDVTSKQIAICDYTTGSLKIIPFQNLIECEIIEDNETVLSGGIGRAIAGGIIAGGTGAIVGAVTRKSKNIVKSLSIRIGTSDINDALIMIPLVTSPVKKESEQYKELWKTAQEIYATLLSIMKSISED